MSGGVLTIKNVAVFEEKSLDTDEMEATRRRPAVQRYADHQRPGALKLGVEGVGRDRSKDVSCNLRVCSQSTILWAGTRIRRRRTQEKNTDHVGLLQLQGVHPNN